MFKKLIMAGIASLVLVSAPSLVMADPGDCTGKKSERDPECNTDPPASGDGVFSHVDIRAGYFTGVSATVPMEDACPYGGDGCYLVNDDHVWGAGFNNWENNTLDEIPRLCVVGATSNDPPSAGRYDCGGEGAGSEPPPDHGGLISIDVTGMGWKEVVGKKPTKEPEFCNLLENWGTAFGGSLEFGATRYTIFFMEGCVKVGGTVSCSIRISTGSYSGVADPHDVQLHPFHDLYVLTGYDLPDVGRLNVSGGVDEEAVNFILPDPDPNDLSISELNVFTVPQVLPINHFRISFNHVKNGALLATCETDVTKEYVSGKGISFVTELEPQPTP